MDWGAFFLKLIDPATKLFRSFRTFKINNKVATIHYYYKQPAYAIIGNIEIGLLIINNSANPKILTDFEARYYEGFSEKWHDLQFDYTKVPRYVTIKPNMPEEMTFNFTFLEEIHHQPVYENSHIRIGFKCGSKLDAVLIDDIRIKEIPLPPTYTWVAF